MKTIILVLHALRDLAIQLLPFRPRVQEGFAFLVHPRDDEDVNGKDIISERIPT